MSTAMAQLADEKQVPSSWTEVDWAEYEHDVEVNGRRMHYVDIGSGDGAPLLLVHGMSASWRDWLANICDLAQDHRVIVPDLPGFGASQGLSWTGDVAPYGDALAGLLDVLDVEQVDLVGHSFGGMVSEHLTINHPDRIRSLVLVAALGAKVHEARKIFLMAGFLGSGAFSAVPPFRFLVEHTPGVLSTVMRAGMVNPAAVPKELVAVIADKRLTAGVVPAMFAARTDKVRDRLGEISAPTRVVWGKQDRILPAGLAPALTEAIPGAELEVWDGVGHLLPLERPEELHAVIRQQTGKAPAPTDKRVAKRAATAKPTKRHTAQRSSTTRTSGRAKP